MHFSLTVEKKPTGNSKEIKETIVQESSQCASRFEKDISPNGKERRKQSSCDPEPWKRNEVFDVLDVQKIARLQEESMNLLILIINNYIEFLNMCSTGSV